MQTKQACTDQELITLYLNGQDKAFETLMLRHKDKVFTSIMLLVKDVALAEDFFQDTFCKVIDKLNARKYNEQGKFLPWVLRIAHNMCMDYFRKTKKDYLFESATGDIDVFSEIPNNSLTPDKLLIRAQEDHFINKFIDLLPEDQKEVLILRHYYEYSFQEIATMTHSNVSTATGRMRYALKNLRKMMDGIEK
jgi:RNA polymerase sigma factor (sigma-70 family)